MSQRNEVLKTLYGFLWTGEQPPVLRETWRGCEGDNQVQLRLALDTVSLFGRE